MLIDTHTHVNFDNFKNDYKEVIGHALKENIWLINVGSDLATSKRAVEIANEYNEGVYPHTLRGAGVYAAAGLHPSEAENKNFDEQEFLKLAQNEKVVAVGETGLDYFRISASDNSAKQKQKELFIKHIELAQKVKKPLIIHCRDAHNDLLELLTTNYSLLTTVPGVMHFFGGDGAWENVQKYLAMGFYISFSGVVTFPKYSHNEDIKKLPRDRILIETDAPYATPEPYRGQRNEPSYVKYTAQKIADIRGISFDELANQATQNARKLFNLTI